MKCALIWQVVQIVICVRGSADCQAIPSSLWVVARYGLHVTKFGKALFSVSFDLPFFIYFPHTLTTPFHFSLGWAAMFASAITATARINFFPIMSSCLILFFKRVTD